MKEYKNVPVEEARRIAHTYDKQIVVINAWNEEHKAMHTVTYGQSPDDKIAAAKAGEITAKALGMDLGNSVPTEDFRTLGAARNAQIRDIMARHLPELDKMADQILDPPDNFFARLVAELRDAGVES